MKIKIEADHAKFIATADDGETVLFSYEVDRYDFSLDTEAIINEAANIAHMVNSLVGAFVDAAQREEDDEAAAIVSRARRYARSERSAVAPD